MLVNLVMMLVCMNFRISSRIFTVSNVLLVEVGCKVFVRLCQWRIKHICMKIPVSFNEDAVNNMLLFAFWKESSPVGSKWMMSILSGLVELLNLQYLVASLYVMRYMSAAYNL